MWLVAAGGIAGAVSARGGERYQATQPHMGVPFSIVLYAPDQATANRGFEAAFRRIDELNGIFSDYSSQSEAMQVSGAAPMERPVPVSKDLWQLLSRARSLNAQSGGAFDVTVGPLTKLWRRSRRQRELPPADRWDAARAAVGFRFVEFDADRQAIRLKRPGMRFDFGGIAKGYAADEAIKVLRHQGISRVLVNASGDIAAGEPPPEKDGWTIGVAPLEPGGPPTRFLQLKNGAIATSGDAFQYVTIAGQRYSHIVDPRTGLGLTTRSSVSVIAGDCTTADGLASAVSVLGPEKGVELADRLPGVAAFVVVMQGDEITTHASRRFQEFVEPQDPP